MNTATEPVVHAREVSFAYRSGLFGQTFGEPALRDASLTIAPGDVHGLVGESGSGKSTLGRVVLGFLVPTAGHVETCGVVPYRVKGKSRRAFRRTVQVVYQDSATALNPRMTLGRSAAEGLEIHGAGAGEIGREMRRLFDQVGLSHRLMDRYPHEVSGGQRQRVCIARALALRPRLLIADEPVTALDVSVQAQILDLFAELQSQLDLAMLFISHDLNVVRELCGRVSVMHQGRIVEEGETANVFERPKSDYTRKLIESIPGKAWS